MGSSLTMFSRKGWSRSHGLDGTWRPFEYWMRQVRNSNHIVQNCVFINTPVEDPQDDWLLRLYKILFFKCFAFVNGRSPGILIACLSPWTAV